MPPRFLPATSSPGRLHFSSSCTGHLAASLHTPQTWGTALLIHSKANPATSVAGIQQHWGRTPAEETKCLVVKTPCVAFLCLLLPINIRGTKIRLPVLCRDIEGTPLSLPPLRIVGHALFTQLLRTFTALNLRNRLQIYPFLSVVGPLPHPGC